MLGDVASVVQAGMLRIWIVILLVLAARGLSPVDEPQLIGWLGEIDSRAALSSNRSSGVVVLSWEPRIFLYHNLLTADEVDYIIKKAKPGMARSGVSNAETGASEYSNIRTSSGTFLDRGQDQVVKRVEDRIAAWTMLPPDHGEGIQVLRYEPTEKYDPHHDYFSFEGKDDNGGNRICTVLMYLTDVEEGGETVFPKVPAPSSQKPDKWSKCAMQGLAVKPRKGDAVAFWSIKPNGAFDYKSLHGGCPVIKGEKWSATKWIHVGHYAMDGELPQKVTRQIYAPPPPPVPPGCKDRHNLCGQWSESGECEANPGFMVGHVGAPGSCIMSCNRCDLMLQTDDVQTAN